MEEKRVLIADCDQCFSRALADRLLPEFQVRLASTGNDAWRQLECFAPDVLVLDLVLPDLDGISLLRQCAARNLRPAVLVTTQLCSEYVLSTLTQLGVDYLLRKPCEPENTAESVRQLCRCPAPPLKHHTLPDTDALLLQLGLSRKLTGCRYLGYAVPQFSRNPEQMLTKELYGAVAQHFHASTTQVERSIRTAIHSAWLTRDERVWQRFFPTGEDGTVRRPTNGEFISRLAVFQGARDIQG